ncbi:MAG: pyrimidine reductase family protein [Mycobacteriaceae bacterium]|nr:pyrimidine reductase family protein [Mycobacteriaceae bacterium]
MSDLESGTAANVDHDTGPQLSLLGSAHQLDINELRRLYDYPQQEPGVWIRANFIASIDGGATAGGVTSTLSGPGDRFLFNLLRSLADVILVGAGTVRIEGYAGAHLTVTQRQHRQDRGQSEVPQLAIVTNAGHLDRAMPVFTRTEVSPLILTCASVAKETRHRLTGLAEVVDCSAENPHTVDEAVMVTKLENRGLRQVLTEGGPTLLNSFIEREMLDELCLSLSPHLVGGQASRISTGPGEVLTRMRRAHILADESGYLYTRYVKS